MRRGMHPARAAGQNALKGRKVLHDFSGAPLRRGLYENNANGFYANWLCVYGQFSAMLTAHGTAHRRPQGASCRTAKCRFARRFQDTAGITLRSNNSSLTISLKLLKIIIKIINLFNVTTLLLRRTKRT
jgi:hypothetical protein